MGNWEKQQQDKRAGLERDRSRRENLGKFFYDLAKLTFAAIVLGEMLVLQKDISDAMSWYMISIGCVFTFLLAWMANRIFK